jgi:hypothetical protein
MMIETGRRANPPRAIGKKIEPPSKKIALGRPCCPFATSDPAQRRKAEVASPAACPHSLLVLKAGH